MKSASCNKIVHFFLGIGPISSVQILPPTSQGASEGLYNPSKDLPTIYFW